MTDVKAFYGIVDDIMCERIRQEQLKAGGRFKYTCADPEMAPAEKCAVLGEEMGEVCRAVLEEGRLANDLHGKALRQELVQVAAVAVAWIEAIDREA